MALICIIFIFIALTVDEVIIFDVLQFRIRNIHTMHLMKIISPVKIIIIGTSQECSSL